MRIRKISSKYIEEKWFLLVYKILAVVCLSSNIDAQVALQVIKLITKQKVKMMGEDIESICCDRCELWFHIPCVLQEWPSNKPCARKNWFCCDALYDVYIQLLCIYH